MKKLIKATAIILIAVGVFTITACPSQQTWAAIWKQAGVLADTFLSIYVPNWPNKEAFDTAWQTAYTDILNWNKGSTCQDVIQAVNDASSLLAQIPVLDSQQTLLMAAIVASVDSVSSFFSQCAPATAAQSHAKFTASVQAAADNLNPPKSVKDVNKLWTDAGGTIPK